MLSTIPEFFYLYQSYLYLFYAIIFPVSSMHQIPSTSTFFLINWIGMVQLLNANAFTQVLHNFFNIFTFIILLFFFFFSLIVEI